MTLPEPCRGEVWDADFAEFGRRPAVVLSVDPLNVRLGHVAVVPVTGTRGPDETHVALTSDAGLTRYDVSYADVTALQPVARRDLVALRGRLAAAELDRVGRQVSVYLGL